MISLQSLPHFLAGAWLVLLGIGYNRYALRKSLRTHCLASVLHQYRVDWVRGMRGHEVHAGRASGRLYWRNLPSCVLDVVVAVPDPAGGAKI